MLRSPHASIRYCSAAGNCAPLSLLCAIRNQVPTQTEIRRARRPSYRRTRGSPSKRAADFMAWQSGKAALIYYCPHIEDVSDIKLMRTDTTLDLSQKAEEAMNTCCSLALAASCSVLAHRGAVASNGYYIDGCLAAPPRFSSAQPPLSLRRACFAFHKSTRLCTTAKPAKNSFNSWVFLSTEVFSKRRKTCTL